MNKKSKNYQQSENVLKKIVIYLLKHLFLQKEKYSVPQVRKLKFLSSLISLTKLNRNPAKKKMKSLLKKQSKATKEKIQKQKEKKSSKILTPKL